MCILLRKRGIKSYICKILRPKYYLGQIENIQVKS